MTTSGDHGGASGALDRYVQRHTRRLDIAHVTATFPPYLAGTGNVASHNARSLVQLGHRVSVYTAEIGGRGGVVGMAGEGYEVHRLRTPFRMGNAPFLPGLPWIRRHDLVHLHCPFIFGAEMTWLAASLKSQPYVVTYHNDLLAPGVKGVLFGLYDRVWGGRVVRGSRRVFVPSIDSAPSSHIVGPILASTPDRIQELPNGVDTAIMRPGVDRAVVRTTLGIDPDEPVLVFVGQMDAAHHGNSGVPILLDAIKRLPRRVTLLLVGGGNRVREYATIARALGIDDRTRFVGPVPNAELSHYFAAADVAVQPSVKQETFGLAAVEAMSCGTPVIVSDLPGARRVVTAMGGGVLARPGDAGDLANQIERLMSDQELRQRLASAGRAGVVAHLDWDRIGRVLERAYLEVLSAC